MKNAPLTQKGQAAVDDVVAIYEAIADRIRHDLPSDFVPQVASRLAAAAYTGVKGFDKVRQNS